MSVTFRDLSVCVDCLVAIANGDYSGMTEARAREVKAGIAARGPLVAGTEAFCFSRGPCDVCHSALFGERHEAHEDVTPRRYTMADIRAANAAAGLFFFSRDTMRYFRSRVEGGPYCGPGGVFFLTSEQCGPHGRDGRSFTVRQFHPDTGRVTTARDGNGVDLNAKHKEDARARARGCAR
jgi:hypothetical protein